jgi:hypothetical protein
VKLRSNPEIRRQMKYARWDAHDALRECHPEVRRAQRDRVRLAVKFCRLQMHRLMRDAKRSAVNQT